MSYPATSIIRFSLDNRAERQVSLESLGRLPTILDTRCPFEISDATRCGPGLASPSSSSRIDEKRPRVALLQQIVEELAPIRVGRWGKTNSLPHRSVSPCCCDCKSSNPFCDHVHHWICKNEAVPTDSDTDSPCRRTDINFYNIGCQICRTGRQALHILDC